MPKPTGKEIADALLAARDLMNTKGKHWIKGRLRRTIRSKVDGKEIKDVSYCSLGAIQAVTREDPQLRQSTLEALASSLPPQHRQGLGLPRHKIMWWNDYYGTSWGDVSRAFKTAARRALKS